MARTLILARLGCLAALSVAGSAWALGPFAPFSPPAVAASGVVEPAAAGAVELGIGLAGVKFGRNPSALIDGHWVTQGGTVRDGVVLVAIERHAVKLKHDDGTVERLALSPGVKMTRSPRNTPPSSRMP